MSVQAKYAAKKGSVEILTDKGAGTGVAAADAASKSGVATKNGTANGTKKEL